MLIKVIFIQKYEAFSICPQFYVKTENYSIAEKTARKQLKKEQPDFVIEKVIMSSQELLEVET